MPRSPATLPSRRRSAAHQNTRRSRAKRPTPVPGVTARVEAMFSWIVISTRLLRKRARIPLAGRRHPLRPSVQNNDSFAPGRTVAYAMQPQGSGGDDHETIPEADSLQLGRIVRAVGGGRGRLDAGNVSRGTPRERPRVWALRIRFRRRPAGDDRNGREAVRHETEARGRGRGDPGAALRRTTHRAIARAPSHHAHGPHSLWTARTGGDHN